MGKLFDDGEDVTISVNKQFAERFQKKKEREQRIQLADKYGDEFGSQDLKHSTNDICREDLSESTSEDEDEEAELLTDNVEKDFLRTLSLIKADNPDIYDKKKEFFSEIALDGWYVTCIYSSLTS